MIKVTAGPKIIFLTTKKSPVFSRPRSELPFVPRFKAQLFIALPEELGQLFGLSDGQRSLVERVKVWDKILMQG